MTSASPPIHAFEFHNGESRTLPWEAARSWSSSEGGLWVHLDRTNESSKSWLREDAGLARHVAQSLLASSTRPRLEILNDGLLMTLRGVNLNEGADPSDMISLRLWVEPHRLISLEREPLRSIAMIAHGVSDGKGPATVNGLLVAMLDVLTDKAGPIIDGINDQLDELEDRVLEPGYEVDRADLLSLRQRVIMMHRHLKPQLDVIAELYRLRPAIIQSEQLPVLRETLNRITRYVEDLDAAKGRTIVIQDELSNQYAEKLNNRMYAVSLIATILLPMSIVTGLLGINVGGIPGTHSQVAFVIVCAILVLMGIGGFWIARRFNWL